MFFSSGDAPRALAHLAAIVESSEDAIISKTVNGEILTWNAGAEKVYGYPADEVIGKPMTLLLPKDRPDEENSILEKIRAGERVQHFETVRRNKAGEEIDVSLTISPIRDESGRIVAASHIARDITAQRKLLSQSRMLAAIVESSDDAIISKTLSSQILTWNRAAEELYGYTAFEAIGRTMTMLQPSDRPDEEVEILNNIRAGRKVEHFETVRRRKDGRLIDVSLTISPVRDEKGVIIAASHSARDITARKQLDQQLRQTQKLESLGVLAGGVAHDFNNLLTGILGNTSLALETLSPNNPTYSLLRDVINASERAALLTRQLLAYAGKGRFVIEPLDLSELTRELSNLIRTSIPKNVQLRLDLRDNLPCIDADAGQLQQLIMNLVINGAEAIDPNANGTVIVTTTAHTVDEHYLRGTLSEAGLPTGTYVGLEIHDSGCGMDQETCARIFDPFFTTKFTGRGLGLAAVQGIVRGHRGLMKVYSNPGKGTTFKVLFPASEQRAPERMHATPNVSPQSNNLILVIDDEEVIRRTAKSMLERYGYAVVVAENGKEGVELFRVLADKVSAVLLDMTMPVMSGEETFGQLMSIRPDIAVILSSGYNEVETIRRFTGKRLAGFIQKPYSSADLLEKIKRAIESAASANPAPTAHA